MTITDTARDMIAWRDAADEQHAADYSPRAAQRAHDESEIARAEIERRLAELFAAGAR